MIQLTKLIMPNIMDSSIPMTHSNMLNIINNIMDNNLLRLKRDMKLNQE